MPRVSTKNKIHNKRKEDIKSRLYFFFCYQSIIQIDKLKLMRREEEDRKFLKKERDRLNKKEKHVNHMIETLTLMLNHP